MQFCYFQLELQYVAGWKKGNVWLVTELLFEKLVIYLVNFFKLQVQNQSKLLQLNSPYNLPDPKCDLKTLFIIESPNCLQNVFRVDITKHTDILTDIITDLV